VNKLNLDLAAFMQEYWQKKPTVLRGAYAPFVDPITPDELAGLATEEQVESRLVTFNDGKWKAAHGPFDDYSQLGESHWALLVQATDHWIKPVADLITPFRGLPNWRIDDVMISYSVPGGGVGPHIDQYDVFIIQGSGSRRWRVGANTPAEQFVATPGLLHVNQFEPIIDVELQTGDILYIPPGFPHDGYAITEAMSYSIGYRAPNQQDLFSSFADFLLQEDAGQTRYTDPQRQLTTEPGLVTEQDVNDLRTLMQSLMQDEQLFSKWLGTTLSQAKHELNILPPQEWDLIPDELIPALEAEDELYRLGGLRCLYFPALPDCCFVNGEQLMIPEGGHELAKLMCNSTTLTINELHPFLDDPTLVEWICYWFNQGYWYLASDAEE
jgi:50S ribosomal protein L16 3-hydroxylase